MSNVHEQLMLTGVDGLDHINVSRVAKTSLGRMLHGSYEELFDVPKHGKFLTMEGYTCWLRTGLSDDTYRGMGFLDVIRKHRKNKANIVHLPYFHLHVKLGMMARLVNNPQLCTMLRESDNLPLLAYRVDPVSGKHKPDQYLHMEIDMWGELRRKLLDNVDLNKDIFALLDTINSL